MAIRSDAQKKAVAKYNAKAYEQILLRVKVGMSEKIKTHAALHDKSVNSFICRAISETMERDQAQPTVDNTAQHDVDDKSIPFLERVKADVEQIVTETETSEEEDWKSWKEHHNL